MFSIKQSLFCQTISTVLCGLAAWDVAGICSLLGRGKASKQLRNSLAFCRLPLVVKTSLAFNK